MRLGIHDPVTLKRWKRFRAHRRAFWSLCILLGLYAFSLVSELIANNRPLYVRFQGRSCFPVFVSYPQDLFMGDGIRTPPDYKALRDHPAFRGAGNIMLFAPIPFGPHEVLDPSMVPHDPTVLLTVAAEAPVGNVNVGPDLFVRRGLGAGWFFGVSDDAIAGRSMSDAVVVSESLLGAVAKRFRNEESPEFVAMVSNTVRKGLVEVSAPAFMPRATAPETVRLSLLEKAGGGRWAVRFGPTGSPLDPVPDQWKSLRGEEHARLRALAMKRMSEEVPDARMVLGIRDCLVKTTREEVSWPHGPVAGHFFGIDSAGRDVLVRLLYGLRISLSFGLVLVVASMALGIALGMVQGYYGGAVDIVGQRLTEIWHAIPLLYVMMLLGAVLGRSFSLLLVSYIVFNWIGISYYLRAEALRLRRLPFVDAARCLGLPDRRIMLRHILPNALTPVITFFPFSLVGAIGLLAALDYLGFGLPALTPSWGEMLHEAQQYRWAWWLILYPSLALFVVMMLGVFVGEGVRDAYDPRPKTRLE